MIYVIAIFTPKEHSVAILPILKSEPKTLAFQKSQTNAKIWISDSSQSQFHTNPWLNIKTLLSNTKSKLSIICFALLYIFINKKETWIKRNLQIHSWRHALRSDWLAHRSPLIIRVEITNLTLGFHLLERILEQDRDF